MHRSPGARQQRLSLLLPKSPLPFGERARAPARARGRHLMRLPLMRLCVHLSWLLCLATAIGFGI